MTITLGTTAPTGAAASGLGNGRMYETAYVLSGAAAGSYFSTIRLRVRNDSASSKTLRGVVYNNSNVLIDWAQYTLAGSAPDQIITVPLLGAVVVADGTYKIGIQGVDVNVVMWIATSGVATTTYYWTTGSSYGAAPPNPWTPTGTQPWQVACAADVDGVSTFVPKIVIAS